jgi:predicted transcriptional regulator
MRELTGCQKQVLDLVRKGKSNKEIAQELNISEQAVKHRLGSVYVKMGIPGEGRSKITLDSSDRLKELELNFLFAIASLSQRLEKHLQAPQYASSSTLRKLRRGSGKR